MNHAEDRSGEQEPQTIKDKNEIRNLGRFLFLRSKVSDPEFPLNLFLLDFLLRGGSGERMINPIILEYYIPPGNHASNQRERDESYKTNHSGGERSRDQKSSRLLIVPPAPKLSEILETLAFPKDSKISEILESLGSPQEAF